MLPYYIMQSGLFFTIFYQPLYNALVFIINVVPGESVGVAIILLTLLVRSALLPLSHKSIVSQSKLRSVAPHIEKLKEEHKDNKQEQARKIMELYRAHGINPFSGLVLVLIQLPIIFALYFVFFKGLPNLRIESLYSFVHAPVEALNMMFLSFSLAAKKNIIFALIAGATQFFQIKLSLPTAVKNDTDTKPSFKNEFTKSLNTQMRYVLPVIVFGVSYSLSAAVALYWATSNLFSIAHELYVKRKAVHITEASN